MFNIHTSADGRKLMICEMDNTHLLNYINMVLRETKLKLDSNTGASGLKGYERHLYGVQALDDDEIAELIKVVSQKLAPYVLEATPRGLAPSLVQPLQEFYGRQAMVVIPRRYNPQLPSGRPDPKFYDIPFDRDLDIAIDPEGDQ